MSPIRREDDHVELGATWEDLVERKIREAQERGDFDDLAGQGRPLRIDKNPYARDWELAYKILKDHEFAPPWVEASREMERALDTPPGELGLPFDAWTSARLGAYLEEATGVRVAPGWLRALLARRRWRVGRPKHSVRHLQDPAEVAACQAELAGAGGKGGRRAGALRAAPPG